MQDNKQTISEGMTKGTYGISGPSRRNFGMMPLQKDMVSPNELTAYLGISRTTLNEWTHRPDFPKAFRPTQRTVIYRLSEIDAWLNGIRDETKYQPKVA